MKITKYGLSMAIATVSFVGAIADMTIVFLALDADNVTLAILCLIGAMFSLQLGDFWHKRWGVDLRTP